MFFGSYFHVYALVFRWMRASLSLLGVSPLMIEVVIYTNLV